MEVSDRRKKTNSKHSWITGVLGRRKTNSHSSNWIMEASDRDRKSAKTKSKQNQLKTQNPKSSITEGSDKKTNSKLLHNPQFLDRSHSSPPKARLKISRWSNRRNSLSMRNRNSRVHCSKCWTDQLKTQHRTTGSTQWPPQQPAPVRLTCSKSAVQCSRRTLKCIMWGTSLRLCLPNQSKTLKR